MNNNYIKKVLKNGVTLYLFIDPNMRRCYVDYAVDYGSSGKYYDFYYEDKLYHVLPGIAHYLEHLLGEHSKYGNIYDYFSKKKYQRNGETSSKLTHYFFCGVDDIKGSIEKIINVVDNPVFTKEDVEDSRHAIAEETKRGLNSKYGICENLCYRNLYKNLNISPESLCRIGNEETTKGIDYDMLKLCYDAFYYDENKYLLIAGNFDKCEMIDFVESVYAKLKPHPKKVKLFDYGNLDEVKTKFDIRYMSTSDDVVTIGFKQKNVGFNKREIALFTKFLLGVKLSIEHEFTSKMKRENIISFYEGGWHSILDDTHYNIMISVDAKDVDKYLEEVIKELKKNNFDKKDFDLFLKTIIAGEAEKLDSKYSVFRDFQYDREYSESFFDIDYFKTLTFDRFIEFYNSLNFDNYTVAVVRDESRK